MEGLQEEFNSLKNRVWKSYKSRINTAERLKDNHEFIAFVSIYYSAVLAAGSILNYVNKSENMEIFLIVLSVMVTILFLYFEGRNYKERYVKMKENYNKLNSLYYKIEGVIKLNEISKENFYELTEQYIELLNSVENHTEEDFIQYAIRDKSVGVDRVTKIRYYIKKFIVTIFKIIIVAIPTAFLLISLFQLMY